MLQMSFWITVRGLGLLKVLSSSIQICQVEREYDIVADVVPNAYNIIVSNNMINRLVAENTFKLPPRSQPTFALNKKLIAFQTDTAIRIKAIHRDAKDIEIPITQPSLQFAMSQTYPWVLLLTPAHLLEIYSIEYISGITQGSFKKIAILHNVEQFWENKGGLVLSTTNKTLKLISLKEIIEKTEVNLNIDSNTLKSLTDLNQPHTILTDISSDRVVVSKEGPSEGEIVSEIYDKVNKQGKYERYASVSYLRDVLCLYRDRYVFQRKGEKEVEIIDIEQSKIVGKFGIDNIIKHCQVRQNLLVIVNNKDNTDYFNFLVLNPEPSSTQPLITNRVTYEKGKGDLYRLYNLLSSESAQYLDKKKNVEVSDAEINKIDENTSSLLFILNKTKEKVQIIKLDHSKLLKSPFGEEKMNHIIYSKKASNLETRNGEQNAEVQRSRIHSSIELKAGEKSMEEMQKRFVESLIEIKLKKVMLKFNQLEQRVSSLEKIIHSINSKIENNLEKINRKEIKQKVEQLFDTLTPQFEKYFSEIFKQVAGVFQQGVSYYNLKLAKEADFHKEALTQIVSETFKFTEEVAEISKKEQSISEKTEQYFRKILDAKKKWNRESVEFQNRTKEVPSPVVRLSPSGGSAPSSEGTKTEGKVFVRADLNYPAPKRET